MCFLTSFPTLTRIFNPTFPSKNRSYSESCRLSLRAPHKDKVLTALEKFEADPDARKGDGDDDLNAALEATKALKIKEAEDKKEAKEAAKEEALANAEKCGFTKKVITKGKTHMKPEKGSVVAVWYTGKLEDGTVFDSNVENARKKDRKALKFKVGTVESISRSYPLNCSSFCHICLEARHDL
eukprot:sb/3471519/